MLKKCLVLLCICAGMLFFSTCKKDRPIGDFRIALTFDDGPDPVYTIRILDILKQKNVKATFFVTGYHARLFPSIIRRMHDEGHLIGNHTFTHLYLPGATTAEMLSEVQRTQNIINRYSGAASSYLFRPPYGYISDEQKHLLKNLGYRVVKWDVDPLDYDLARSTPDAIADRVLLLRGNNKMVLMHSADYSDLQSRENTVLALPRIIDELRNKYNYSFITVDQIP
ncbi:MAG: polysaccharide deacetylase family protein [Bacteroidetes bacterium]|nr:polysaccharide deacetylase family protein [Bacteroidota bacterium]